MPIKVDLKAVEEVFEYVAGRLLGLRIPAFGLVVPFLRQDHYDRLLERLLERNIRLEVLIAVYKGQFKADAPDEQHLEFDGAKRQQRAYRLAVTDLFVETALGLLNRKALAYQFLAIFAYVFSVTAILFGLAVAFAAAHPGDLYFCSGSSEICSWLWNRLNNINEASNYAVRCGGKEPCLRQSMWFDMFDRFSKGFTFYGFIVLSAVTVWRFGKALMDQAERLHDRRHALRQGRLFVHLRDGVLTVDEMDRAFAWNIQQPNAFGEMPTDAKAPWGSAIADLGKVLPEAVKAGADAARGSKSK